MTLRKRIYRPCLAIALAAVLFATACAIYAQTSDVALLVIAHGAKKPGWNERVIRMMGRLEWPGPKAVAFLTPSNPEEELAEAAARLDKPEVRRIVVVPFLVSSFSDHYEEIRYYAGDRQQPPEHYTHEPLKTKARLAVTKAMDDNRILGRILADQIRSVSADPSNESVILVAHGPNDDADNEKWLACLKAHAAFLQETVGFRRVDVATIRDDAPKPVKDAAVAMLRERVTAAGADSTVLIQPVLISAGHVQAEIAELLKGLQFKMSASGITDHPLAAEWISRQAAGQ